jgi:hypothetical protein
MGWKSKKICKLQADAADDKERDCPTRYTAFRLMERFCRRFHPSPNPLLPNVHPDLLIPEDITNLKGVVLLKGFLSIETQRHLIRSCLELNHISNLDKHYIIPQDETLWDIYRGDKEYSLEPRDIEKNKSLPISKAIRDIRWKILVNFSLNVVRVKTMTGLPFRMLKTRAIM